MTEYIPTTEHVRHAYLVTRTSGPLHHGVVKDEFDRWLRQVQADAWDEGHAAGRINEHEWRPRRQMTNPYRNDPTAVSRG